MNYELALELEKEGFPGIKLIDGILTRTPTLSELIEACRNLPEGFISLTAPKITCEGDEFGVTCGWVAVGYLNETKIEKLSTSPEEAVARLYLQLKRSSDSIHK